MNILFVNYGDFTTNSLNHIGGFAGWLTAHGHACVVAVPEGRDTLQVINDPQFGATTYAEALAAGGSLFPDGRPADLLHAWTPRESVRQFVLAHQRLSPGTRVIVHLEDNEEHLLATFAGRSVAELRKLPDDDLAALLPASLSHPVRYRQFLGIADGWTVITPRLREFLPAANPTLELPPGVDFTQYHPQMAESALRRQYGATAEDRVIVFTGSTTFATAPGVRELCRALHLLEQRQLPVRLIRTGFHPESFSADYDFDWRRLTVDVGFVDKARLPALLALADVLVQPGQAGPFDNYRLPSKLPEFLAMGKPVIAPATILPGLQDGIHAALLTSGSGEEIADRAAAIFRDPALANRLSKGALAFARAHFDLAQIGPRLVAFYSEVSRSPARTVWSAATANASEGSLAADRLRRDLATVLTNRPESLRALEDLATRLEQLEAGQARGSSHLLQQKHKDELELAAKREKLSREHTANLEKELLKERQDLRETRRKLNETRLNLNETHRMLQEAHRKLHEANLALAETARQRDLAGAEAASQRRLAKDFQAELARSREQAAADQARQAEALFQREHKIRRMQSSFSWQVTAPLRALRRFFEFVGLRKVQPTPVNPLPAALPAPLPLPVPGVRIEIDEPLLWHLPNGVHPIRGWCLLAGNVPPAKLRARIGDRFIAGTVGLARADVAAIHGIEAGRSGFVVEVLFEPGGHDLIIEAADDDENWHELHAAKVTVFATPSRGTREPYEQWLQLYEARGEEALAPLRDQVAALANPPLISVIMPVYNAPEKWLRRAIESVRQQVYERWELCIADDASPNPQVRAVLEDAMRSDSRIKIVFRPLNGHISAASNSALELATGEFVALLDHDDELPPQALARMALEIDRHPEGTFFYSDEDKIDETGRRFEPYFKPDFLPDLLTGQNCLSHLSVIRTTAVREVGGFRRGLEGSQDWDLALRITERCGPAKVHHVPEVLYHWRTVQGSTSLAVSEKSYSVTAARQALYDHFSRRKLAVQLQEVDGGHWRVIYPLPSPAPLVSLVIPTRNCVDLLRTCVASILQLTDYPAYEILIVDNQSDDPATLAWLGEIVTMDSRVRVLAYDRPFNYSAINNFAAQQARGAIVGLLNNDLECISSDWLREMASHAVRAEIGCVGAMLYYPNNTIQHAGIVLGLGGVANHAFCRMPRGTDGYMNRGRLVQNYSAVTAACLLVRREVYLQVGGLNERDLAVAFNDVDFCLRVRAAGYRNLWTPFAEFYHHESASRGLDESPVERARFISEVEYMQRTWGPLLAQDPAYNRNLSVDLDGFKLARPPRRPIDQSEPASTS